MMALGAVKAIEDMNLSDQITVIGFDATDDAKAAIKEGRMYASVAQSPDLMGTTALDVLQQLKDEGKCEAEIAIDVELVTEENAG